MCTVRSMAISWGMYLILGGMYWSQGGVPGPGGVYLVQGTGYLVLMGVYLVQGEGVYLVPGGVPGRGGCTGLGGSAPGGCPWPGGLLPGGFAPRGWGQYLTRYSPCGQTDACKNITFATSLWTVIRNSLLLTFHSSSHSLNIRLCKNYTKVTRWCGRSIQWTQ